MLSPEEITQYHEDGYVIRDFRVPAEALEAIKAMHASLLAQRPKFRDYCPALLDHDRGFLRFAQDGEYWPIRPLATCTAWLAVDDSTPENGCLRVIRGSHKGRALKAHHTVGAGDVTLTQELDAGELDETDAVDSLGNYACKVLCGRVIGQMLSGTEQLVGHYGQSVRLAAISAAQSSGGCPRSSMR